MKINKTLAVSIAVAAMGVITLVAVPALAQTNSNGGAEGIRPRNAGGMSASTTRPFRGPMMASSTWRMGSTTRPMMGSTTRGVRGMIGSSTLQQRMANLGDRGGRMLDQRVSSLQKMLDRIQKMKNLSDSQKASFSAEIQAEIGNLGDLKTKISDDTSTTTLKTDLQSITKSLRVYALIEPRANITAAADRVNTLVTMLKTVSTKIQARLATDATASADVTVQSSLTDLAAKLTDASTQSTSATTEVAGLQPDNGNQTVFLSNEAALKDAHSKIQTAQKDIVAARKDVQTIVKVLMADIKALGNTESTSTNSQ